MRQAIAKTAGHQFVKAGEKRSESLAAAGRRGDESVVSGGNGWPALLLGLGWRAKLVAEPSRQKGMEGSEGICCVNVGNGGQGPLG